MSFELGLKKAGVPLIRSFLQAVEGVIPAMPSEAKRRTHIQYKYKTFKDGKLANTEIISRVEDAFPAHGDKK